MKYAVLASVLLAGCSSILGLDDPRLSSDAGGDAGNPNDIVGHFVNKSIPDNVPFAANTAADIRALVPDDNEPTGFRTIGAEGMDDSDFRIRDVPTGFNYVALGTSLIWTDARVVDDYYLVPFHVNGDKATDPTPLEANVTLSSPWQDNSIARDSLAALSLSTVGYSYDMSTSTAPEATTVTGTSDFTSFSNNFGLAATLPIATDDFRIIRTRSSRYFDSYRYYLTSALIDSYSPAPLTVTNGANVALTGTMTTSGTKHTAASCPRGMLGNSLPTSFGLDSCVAQVLINLGETDPFQTIARIELSDFSRGSDVPYGEVDYDDPFPTTMHRSYSFRYERRRQVRLGTTTQPAGLSASVRQVSESNSFPTQISVVAPSKISLGGKDVMAGGLVRVTDAKPIALSWTGSPLAKLYSVRIVRLYEDGNRTRSITAGYVTSSETSIPLPQSVFTGGEFFALEVTAIRGADLGALGSGSNLSRAMVTTSVFRVSSTCGDGTVQAGEQCDTGGASSTCDEDCTIPRCGDGILNVAAGEACDTGVDSYDCDSDCTLPMCGDGHVNKTTEDCEGSTGGCNGSCRATSSCGNSVTEALEECDDGNQVAGDGCSQCRLD